jgi:hypothetical protein
VSGRTRVILSDARLVRRYRKMLRRVRCRPVGLIREPSTPAAIVADRPSPVAVGRAVRTRLQAARILLSVSTGGWQQAPHHPDPDACRPCRDFDIARRRYPVDHQRSWWSPCRLCRAVCSGERQRGAGRHRRPLPFGVYPGDRHAAAGTDLRHAERGAWLSRGLAPDRARSPGEKSLRHADDV